MRLSIKMLIIAMLLTISTPAFCERGGIIFGVTVGYLSRTGLILGYSATDRLLIEFHFGASACATAALSRTWGISLKYRPIADNDKFYLLAGWSTVEAAPPRVSLKDEHGNTYTEEKISSGLNLGVGYEFSINQEKGAAKRIFWLTEGGYFHALKSESWRITSIDGEQKMSKGRDGFIKRFPFINTGGIFYSRTKPNAP